MAKILIYSMKKWSKIQFMAIKFAKNSNLLKRKGPQNLSLQWKWQKIQFYHFIKNGQNSTLFFETGQKSNSGPKKLVSCMKWPKKSNLLILQIFRNFAKGPLHNFKTMTTMLLVIFHGFHYTNLGMCCEIKNPHLVFCTSLIQAN